MASGMPSSRLQIEITTTRFLVEHEVDRLRPRPIREKSHRI